MYDASTIVKVAELAWTLGATGKTKLEMVEVLRGIFLPQDSIDGLSGEEEKLALKSLSEPKPGVEIH